MMDVAPLLEAAVRTATPLLFAAVGESVAERAGVINIGLEGCIIAGAFAAFAIGGLHPIAGYAAAVGAGVLVGALFAWLSIGRRLDQVLVGTALTMLALGITGALFRARGESVAAVGASEPVVVIPLLSKIPIVGAALFAQPLTSYLGVALAVAAAWFLKRARAGLALRAVGDSHDAAEAAGVRVGFVQTGAVLFGAAMGGLAGGTLVLAQAGSFAEGMSAGRGFIAIAIVALGRWKIGSVAIASFGFGLAMALQYVVQSLGWKVRYELVLMIPYVIALLALGVFGRGVAPPMLGKPRA